MAASHDDELFALVYEDLCAIADNLFRGQPPGHTLQATALVHEVYLKLARSGGDGVRDRTHVLAMGAKMMHQILIDHARRRRATKRGGGVPRSEIRLDSVALAADRPPIDVLDLHDALSRLEELSPRQAEVVQLRFFGGLTVEESAAILGVTDRTVKSDWQFARAWLLAEFFGDGVEKEPPPAGTPG